MHAYTNWLGYAVLDRGDVSEDLAKSWGAPRMAGRPYIVMEPQSGNDVFIRAVQINPVAGYKPMTTLGWNVIQVPNGHDLQAVYQALKKG